MARWLAVQDVLDHVLVVNREVNVHSELLAQLRCGSSDSRSELQHSTDNAQDRRVVRRHRGAEAITGFYGMNTPYTGFGGPAVSS